MTNKRRRGRRREPHRFVRLEHTLLHSVAYRSLSVLARALLLEMVSLHNGSNNGRVFLSQRDAAAAAGVADVGAAGRALRELVDCGFIRVTTRGAFSVKERHATAFRLTFEPCEAQPPTNDWRKYSPEQEGKAWKRLSRAAKTNLQCGKAACAVLETNTPFADGRRQPPFPVQDKPYAKPEAVEIAEGPDGSEANTHIVCHTPGQEMASTDQCNALREEARSWLKRTIGGQRLLARTAGLHESKLSRFLNDPHGRRRLTVQQANSLNEALGCQGQATTWGSDRAQADRGCAST
jgi:hypothetical protein